METKLKYSLIFSDKDVPKAEILIIDGPIEIRDFQLLSQERVLAINLSGRGWHLNRRGNDRSFRNLKIEAFVE